MAITNYKIIFKPGFFSPKTRDNNSIGLDLEKVIAAFLIDKGFATNPSGDCCTVFPVVPDGGEVESVNIFNSDGSIPNATSRILTLGTNSVLTFKYSSNNEAFVFDDAYGFFIQSPDESNLIDVSDSGVTVYGVNNIFSVLPTGIVGALADTNQFTITGNITGGGVLKSTNSSTNFGASGAEFIGGASGNGRGITATGGAYGVYATTDGGGGTAAVFGTSTSALGGQFISINGQGVTGTSTTSGGGVFISDSSIGLYGATTTGASAAQFVASPVSTNAAETVAQFHRGISGGGTAANNIGAATDWYVQTTAGAPILSGREILALSNATHASRESQWQWWSLNTSQTMQQNMTLKSTGQLQLNRYTSVLGFSGTVNSQIAVDSSGNVIQTKNASGSFSQVGAGTTTFTVTIGRTQVNTTYNVQVTPTASLSAALFYVTNKTTTAFDVVYLAGLTGTVTFDWVVTQQ